MNLYYTTNKFISIYFFCCVFIFLSNKVIAQGKNVIVESEIGVFNFDTSFISESHILEKYGQGCFSQNGSGQNIFVKKRIYYLEKENMWLEIHFSHVLDANLESWVDAVIVTKKKLCDIKIEPDNSFGAMITSKGVYIGDSLDKVIRIYGIPSIRTFITPDKSFQCALKEYLKLTEGQVLGYYLDNPDRLLFTEFYFDKNDLLNSLIISAEE